MNRFRFAALVSALLVMSLMTATFSTSKASNDTPEIQWQVTYDSYEGRGMVQTADGGFAVVGAVSEVSGVVRRTSGFLMKLNASGAQSWTRTYQIVNSETAFERVLQASDGGFVVGGERFVSQNVNEVFMAKLDLQGNLLWQKTYFRGSEYENGHSLDALIRSRDGGYLLAEGFWHQAPTDFWTWLLRTDAAGNLLANRTLYGALGGFSLSALLESGDRSITAVGTTSTHYPPGSKVQIIKLDQNFNTQWNATYGDTYNGKEGLYINNWGSSALRPDNGGYIMFGGTEPGTVDENDLRRRYGWVVKANQNGTMEWNKIYEDFHGIDSVVQNSKGEYVFVGRGGNSSWVYSVNSFGNKLWTFEVPDWTATLYPARIAHVEIITQTNEGDYVVLNSNWESLSVFDDGRSISLVRIKPPLVYPAIPPQGESVTEPFPTIVVTVAGVFLGAVVVSLLVYLKKRKREAGS